MSERTRNRSLFTRLASFVRSFGPGLITAAVVLGPGSITVSSKSGATMGYSILWTVLVAGIMMVFFTGMGTRIGLSSKESFLTNVAATYGRWVAVAVGVCGFLIATGFQTGNNVGAGMAAEALTGRSMELWAVVFTGITLAMMWFSPNIYKVLERLMIVLVLVMIVCFFGNLTMVRPDPVGLLRGFIPSRPAVLGLVIAISATTFSVAAAAFQPYLVQAKGWTRSHYVRGMRDTVVGIGMLVAISMVIMITSAAVLQPAGIKVESAVDMARQLEPLLGSWARWLFLVGLWAGAFSSFIINAMVGGVLLADGLGKGDSIDSTWGKGLASVVMVLGTIAALVFGKNPIQLLVVAQGTTILGVPLIAVVMILLANREKEMADLKNRLGSNIIAACSLLWLLYLSWSQFSRLFLG